MAGSKPALGSPYYLENAAVVTDRLPIRDDDQHPTAMQLRGRVTGMDGRPLARATIAVWHSTPEGRYSGIHDGLPPHYYRGKILTDADGLYTVRSLMPFPYQVPIEGPPGALLPPLGRTAVGRGGEEGAECG